MQKVSYRSLCGSMIVAGRSLSCGHGDLRPLFLCGMKLRKENVAIAAAICWHYFSLVVFRGFLVLSRDINDEVLRDGLAQLLNLLGVVNDKGVEVASVIMI